MPKVAKPVAGRDARGIEWGKWRGFFLSGIGFIYFVAFLSFYIQSPGLYGVTLSPNSAFFLLLSLFVFGGHHEEEEDDIEEEEEDVVEEASLALSLQQTRGKTAFKISPTRLLSVHVFSQTPAPSLSSLLLFRL
jgi:hypothetical protein